MVPTMKAIISASLVFCRVDACNLYSEFCLRICFSIQDPGSVDRDIVVCICNLFLWWFSFGLNFLDSPFQSVSYKNIVRHTTHTFLS